MKGIKTRYFIFNLQTGEVIKGCASYEDAVSCVNNYFYNDLLYPGESSGTKYQIKSFHELNKNNFMGDKIMTELRNREILIKSIIGDDKKCALIDNKRKYCKNSLRHKTNNQLQAIYESLGKKIDSIDKKQATRDITENLNKDVKLVKGVGHPYSGFMKKTKTDDNPIK